jgi:hypothetical protein
MSPLEVSLNAWLAIAEHEAGKHSGQAMAESNLHQLLVPASQFLASAKQFARAGDLAGAQRQLETVIGLVLFACAKHFPAPDLGLVGIVRAAKAMQSSRN